MGSKRLKTDLKKISPLGQTSCVAAFHSVQQCLELGMTLAEIASARFLA